MAKATEIYRNATFSKETRERLHDLLVWLYSDRAEPSQFTIASWRVAVADVLDRWDADGATIVEEPTEAML
jgi:hypothetical protein